MKYFLWIYLLFLYSCNDSELEIYHLEKLDEVDSKSLHSKSFVVKNYSKRKLDKIEKYVFLDMINNMDIIKSHEWYNYSIYKESKAFLEEVNGLPKNKIGRDGAYDNLILNYSFYKGHLGSKFHNYDNTKMITSYNNKDTTFLE